MKTTRILWSGLTGKTGRAAMKQMVKIPDVEIVAGLKRNTSDIDYYRLRDEVPEGMDWFNYQTGMFGLYGLV